VRVPCRVVIEKSSSDKSQSSGVEFRDASLPGYELGSRGMEMSRVSRRQPARI
jgi:hypothetical protein